MTGGARQVDATVETMPSVLWDAVVLPDGDDAVEQLGIDGRVLEFIGINTGTASRSWRLGRPRVCCRRPVFLVVSGHADPGLLLLKATIPPASPRSSRPSPSIGTSNAKRIRRACWRRTNHINHTRRDNMAEAGTLHDAFIDELRDTDAEKQLTKALPRSWRKRRRTSCVRRSRAIFKRHRARSRASRRSSRAWTKRCTASTAMASPASSKKAKSIMEEDFDDTTMDACLIAAGQRAEHYEMAAYGTLVAWAQAMGHTEAAKLLQQTLDEEEGCR